MAATRLIALHRNKGLSVARSISDRTDYAKNPEKTEKGELVTAFCCDPMTVDAEFLLQKRMYYQLTGKTQTHDVIAYQIRQSFKPGEITPEEANRVGQELAMRFTKGKYSFIVATHTDRAHIHNHIVFNSTAIDGTRKFKNFWFSGIALQRLSDLVCLENGLSVITPAPYFERTKRTDYPQKGSIRSGICKEIDDILAKKPKTFSEFLKALQDDGYEIKQGKHLAVKNKSQKRFIRFSSLGARYSEADIRDAIAGEKKHGKNSQNNHKQESINLVLDIQAKIQEKGPGYERWAKVYNLKQISKTLLYLRDNKINSLDQLRTLVAEKTARRDELLSSIHASESRLAEIAALKKHITNYSKTRSTYEEYRKAGYSKKFFETHREELSLHKAAKAAFDELRVKKIPRMRELLEEYSDVLSSKKVAYSEYRRIRDETQKLIVAERNIEALYNAEKRAELEKMRDERHSEENIK